MITACAQKKYLNSNYYCAKLELICTRDNQIVSFITSRGRFDVELFGSDNPVTVSNFMDNIKNDIYENQKFYKIIKYPQMKIIHSGINPKNNYYQNKDQFVKPRRNSIPLEIKIKNVVEPIYKFEFESPTQAGNIKNLFDKGVIAMVKSGQEYSSATEFFFVTDKIPELNGRYSIFGKIVKGFEILEKIDNEDYIYEIKTYN